MILIGYQYLCENQLSTKVLLMKLEYEFFCRYVLINKKIVRKNMAQQMMISTSSADYYN